MSNSNPTRHQARGKWWPLASFPRDLLDRPVRRWLRNRSREPGIKQGHRSRLFPPSNGLTARPAI